ncbi:MAG: DNA-directed RNA polymerase subunit beta' [Clostridia bacterium]|nr:DNA-directed RNA polymerase subunit beta' [Clostridia bacterium]
MEFKTFESIKIGLASPEEIRSWSFGEVKKPETINYRTLKPEREGLFCEKIFGPTKDWECSCGKYKRISYKGKVCERCGVEVTRNKVRRERMGHIELAAPVSHIWYFKGMPSRIGLMLDISPKALEKVLYFSSYIVTYVDEDGAAYGKIEKKEILGEKEYRDLKEKYEEDFEAQMGAEAIKLLLDEIDVEELSKQLKEELNDAAGQKRVKLLKRFEAVESFRLSGNKPGWMILEVLPVIPPDLRPMVQLDGGRFATSDLNDLYRRVINRNNRLRKLIELQAPEIIIRNEKRMLQEAVDSLIDNGRRGKAVGGPSNRDLKSLSDMLKGKQGRFRQNLLGKRVDYSGRSVIVVGPDLKLYQCGLPKEMAVELFKPFVMKRLVEIGEAKNIKSAKKMVERMDVKVWDCLEEVIKNHPVLLNRAPTLHRLGIQAFEPVLVEGRALKLHPLVCTAYNADFDGDQMAVHVPISVEAQAEARILMLAANNLLKPQDGNPVTVPTQDMILGSYYLTVENDKEIGTGNIYRNKDEAIMAYQTGAVGLHAPVKVRLYGEWEGTPVSKIVDCTVGQLIFNTPIPQDLGFIKRNADNCLDLEVTPATIRNLMYNGAGPKNADGSFKKLAVDKKVLSKIIEFCIKTHGIAKTSEILDMIKAQGFKYSTKGAITISVSDMVVPPEKKEYLKEAEEKVDNVVKNFNRGFMSDEERSSAVIKIWEECNKKVTAKLVEGLDEFNPIYMMSNSGARGSLNQMRQLAGMRGLMANTSGKTIEVPIRANFREGLNILEYFISSRGARKGLADTALRTADSGYLTRRLVDVSQEVIVRESDCGTDDGIWISAINEGNEKIEKLEARLVGRTAAEDIVDPATGEVLVLKNELMDEDDAKKIVAAGITRVKIRSILTCKSRHGICAKCYGSNLAEGIYKAEETLEGAKEKKWVNLGEAVGIIAAQAIGEPGTQLTMRTFHTGGVAGKDITQGLPRVEELFEARRPKSVAMISEIFGTVKIEDVKNIKKIIVSDDENGVIREYLIPYTLRIKQQVVDGYKLKKGEEMTDGSKYPQDILAVGAVEAITDEELIGLIDGEYNKNNTFLIEDEPYVKIGERTFIRFDGKYYEYFYGEDAVRNYIVKEVQKVYRLQSVEINDRHIEVIVRQMMSKVKVENINDTDLLCGVTTNKQEVYAANRKIDERIAAGEENLVKAETSPMILGITKASLATESFLSAASFQETTRVLTDAAVKGKKDPLVGLKENVIIGKLIPAGTGLEYYRDCEVSVNYVEPAEPEEEPVDVEDELYID